MPLRSNLYGRAPGRRYFPNTATSTRSRAVCPSRFLTIFLTISSATCTFTPPDKNFLFFAWASTHHLSPPTDHASKILRKNSSCPPCTFRSRSTVSSAPLVLRTAGVTPNPPPSGFSSTSKVWAAWDHQPGCAFLLRSDRETVFNADLNASCRNC